MRNNSIWVIFAVTVVLGAQLSFAVISPVFSVTYDDARTDDNQFHYDGKEYWSIDAAADSYQNEYYERPTTQTFTDTANGYGASKYHANLDITTASAGYDSQYMYVQINLVGNYFHKDDDTKDFEGLKYEYGFRFSNDADGAYGYYMRGEFADPYSQTTWTELKTKGSWDSNGDIGGLNGGLNDTKSDGDYQDDGYDSDIINDGELLSTGDDVLFIRMLDTDTVELALDYAALGLDAAYIEGIQYLDMQSIKGGPTDPRNYFWNDKYTLAESGDPYYPGTGLGNIYELDTIRGGAIPEPATMVLLGLGALLLRRKK